MIHVSWYDVLDYLAWLSGKTGEVYRLLSEAEWEYVTRAGTTTPFHTGDTISLDQANYDERYSYPGGEFIDAPRRRRTVPVGSYAANAFGLYNMHGNVSEWVADCPRRAGGGYQNAPVDGSVWEGGDCSTRILRGGSWFRGPNFMRSAHRSLLGRLFVRTKSLGFRVAREITQ